MPRIVVRNEAEQKRREKIITSIEFLPYLCTNLGNGFSMKTNAQGFLGLLLSRHYIFDHNSKPVAYFYTEDDAIGGHYECIEVTSPSFKDEAVRVATNFEKLPGASEITIFVP